MALLYRRCMGKVAQYNLNSMTSQVSYDAFRTIFPKYSELLSESSLPGNESIESFLREELPRKVQLVRSMESFFNAFLTHFTTAVLKRPQHTQLLKSFRLKASDKIQAYFQQLSLLAHKTDSSKLRDKMPQVDLHQLKREFRGRLEGMQGLLKQKYFGGAIISRDCEEEVSMRLYVLLELYFFLKGDPVAVAAKFRFREQDVLSAVSRNEQPGDIADMLFLDTAFLPQLQEAVQKRCRPFSGKRQQLQHKVRETLREGESRVQPNLQLLLESLISKERVRIGRELGNTLLRDLLEIPECDGQAEVREMVAEVQILRRQFSALKNTSYYLDIMRGSFSEKYKMEVGRLQNVFYLTNLQKFLQDVSTFLEKVLALEERVIRNRRDYMRDFGNSIELKISDVIDSYSSKTTSSSLSEVIAAQLDLLQSALYGIVSKPREQPTSNISQDRESREAERRRQLEERAQQERQKKQAERARAEERRRQDEERLQQARLQREEKERHRREQNQRIQQQRKAELEQKRQQKLRKDEQLRRQREQQLEKKDEQERAKRQQQNKKRQDEEQRKKRQREEDQRRREQEKKRILQKQEEQKRKKEGEMKERRKQEEQDRLKREKDRKAQEDRMKREKEEREAQQKRKEEDRLKSQRDRKEKQSRQAKERKAQEERIAREKEDKLRKEQQQKQRLEREKNDSQSRERQQREKKEREERQRRERQDRQRRQKEQKQRSANLQLQKKKRQQKEKKQRQEKENKVREQRQKKLKEQNERKQREQKQRKQKLQREKKQKQEKERFQRQRKEKEQQQRQKRQREQRQKIERQEKQRKDKQLKQKKQKEEKESKEKEQRQRRQKIELQKKQKEQKQHKQKQERDRLQRERLQKQRLQKEKLQKERLEKEKKLKQQRQLQEKRQKEEQQRLKKEQQAKNNAAKKPQQKKSSGINYGEFDDDEFVDDDLEEISKANNNNNKGKPLANRPNQSDEYIDDFDEQSPQKANEIQAKQLISPTDIKCLNDYMKGTTYARKNKVNAELLNKASTYMHLFEEFVMNKKIFIFDSAIAQALIDLGVQILNPDAQESQLQMSVDTIREEMLRLYDQTFPEEQMEMGCRYVIPFAFNNDIHLRLIEFIPGHCYFRLIFDQPSQDEQELNNYVNGILEGLLNVFDLQGEPQLEMIVLNEESRLVLGTFDKEMPCILVLFANHYEQGSAKQILINQYTIERLFYTTHPIDSFYDAIKEEDQIVDFYSKLNEKYGTHDKVQIHSIVVTSSDEQYQQKIAHSALALKEQFLKSKQQTFLSCYTIEIQDQNGEAEERISVYLALDKASPKPTASYFLVCKDQDEQENASIVLECMQTQGDDNYDVSLYTDFTRHHCLSTYSDWSLPLWAHTIIKRKLNNLQAFRAIAFAMTPFYLAFKEMD